jgi:hypothetical protein
MTCEQINCSRIVRLGLQNPVSPGEDLFGTSFSLKHVHKFVVALVYVSIAETLFILGRHWPVESTWHHTSQHYFRATPLVDCVVQQKLVHLVKAS